MNNARWRCTTRVGWRPNVATMTRSRHSSLLRSRWPKRREDGPCVERLSASPGRRRTPASSRRLGNRQNVSSPSPRRAADPIRAGRGLMTIAAVTRLAGDYAESERCLHEAIALAREIGDLELENSARGNLGVIHHLVGDATGSIDAYLRRRGVLSRGARDQPPTRDPTTTGRVPCQPRPALPAARPPGRPAPSRHRDSRTHSSSV